ncbi:MAG: hypothetical protein RR033_03560 [Clostridia bacterium]
MIEKDYTIYMNVVDEKVFFDKVFNAGLIGSQGHQLLSEFTGELGAIRGGTYYSAFVKLAVFVDLRYNIARVKQITVNHVYELLEFLKSIGFKSSTIKSYITAVRQVYLENIDLFSNNFIIPSVAGWSKWESDN